MTQYKIVGQFEDGVQEQQLKADTIGLAATEACHVWQKAPKAIACFAWLKDKGREQWIECYVAPAFLKVLQGLYG